MNYISSQEQEKETGSGEVAMQSVLIIDDHKSWLSVLNSILGQSGYQVRIASTAMGGLKAVETDVPDIILLDLMMPEMNGYQLCERLRKMPALENTPILVVSARSHTTDLQKAYDAGANDYMIKPVHPIELINRMQELLDKQDSSIELPS